MYYIGYDVGSSSVKAALVKSSSGKVVAVAQEPQEEIEMISHQVGWAEQAPDIWWKYICRVTHSLLSDENIAAEEIKGIGIAYQMHGLVVIGKDGLPLRPSIIWCDGRAVAFGDKALADLGPDRCRRHLLNSPGNFTASKLKWVKENEPELYLKIKKFMLPGDYIAYKFSNKINTTIPGLSEGILWDFESNGIADFLFDYYEIDRSLIPDITKTFSEQARVSKEGAAASGLKEGTPILYRAGDQPNNALSLDVFEPGEIAATGGTSGVVYAISDTLSVNEYSRVNNFAHVNHSSEKTRIGKLLCINGSGIQYRWLRNNLNVSSYQEMNDLAITVDDISNNLFIYPFGNGPERMLDNKDVGARIVNLNFNLHSKAHLCRSALQGIAFSFAYGMEIMERDGIKAKTVKTGNDNLFRSDLFSQTVATLLNTDIEIYNTTGAIGAARACYLQTGDFKGFRKQLRAQDFVMRYSPQSSSEELIETYQKWKFGLENILKHHDHGTNRK